MSRKHPPLILLFGMPRSGTTWIGKIFDSHPDTLYRHEPNSATPLKPLPLFMSEADAETHRGFIEQFVRNLPSIRHEKVSASMPIFAKSYYSPSAYALRKLLVYGTKAAANLLGSLPVPDVVDYGRHGDIPLVWKSVIGLGRLAGVARIFPEARGIIILRHPCGYVASMVAGERQGKFQADKPISEDWDFFARLSELPQAQQRRLDLATIREMKPVERFALSWALSYEHALAQTQPMEHILAMRYEDFCHDPVPATRRAFQHCGLPWATETERFIAHSTSRSSDAYYSVFKDPKVAAEKWRKSLAPDDIRAVLNVTQGFLAGGFYQDTA